MKRRDLLRRRDCRRVLAVGAALALGATQPVGSRADDGASAAGNPAPLPVRPAATAAAPSTGDKVDGGSPWDDVEGSVRTGFRILSGDRDGRFQQDRSLTDGPRIFDAEIRGDDRVAPAGTTSWELGAHGLGDANQDARLAVSRDQTLDVTAGWMRDDYNYAATGDPYPYDTIRQRANVKATWTPSRDVTLRFAWDRSQRDGDAYTVGDTDRRPFPPPVGVDPDKVTVHRPLSQESDRFTLGGDLRTGPWRFSLSETAQFAQIDDVREYDIPASRRGADPVREDLERNVRSSAWTTLGKAGVTLFDGDLDVNAIGSFTEGPVESRIGGTARGSDFFGGYSTTYDGGNRLRRSVTDFRTEAIWHATKSVDVVLALEQNNQVDDASLRLIENQVPDAGTGGTPQTIIKERTARITNRGERASGEVDFAVTDDLRLRVGEEFYRQTIEDPVSSRGNSLVPTDFATKSFRTLLGADWKAMKSLDLHALAKFGQQTDPHAATGAENSDEFSFRGRWKASDTLSLTSVWKHKGFTHSDEFDSATRSDSATVAGTWTPSAWSISGSVTWQNADSRTDTLFYSTAGGGFQQLATQTKFLTRDVIASLDLRYAFTSQVRGHVTGTRTDARGGYEAAWEEIVLGLEVDLSKTVTIGADLSSWRLDERDANADDYHVLGIELSATVRF